MTLSMWILYDELKSYTLKPHITDGNTEAEGVRLFTDGENISQRHVYIDRASEFFGGKAKQCLLALGHDVILIENCEIEEIMNVVIRIFERYSDWDKRLNEAKFAEEPYQEILEVAHEIFQCPMLLGCKNLQIYAITKQYTDVQVYKGWDEVKTIKTIPVWLINKLHSLNLVDWCPDDVDPAVIPVWPDMQFNHQLRFNCYLNNTHWGHLMLYRNETEVNPAVLKLAKHVADIYGTLLSGKHQKNPEEQAMLVWLNDLLDGKKYEAGTLHTLFWSLRWSETDQLVLYRIMSPKEHADQNIFYWLNDSIRTRITNAIVFPYKDSIIVIVRKIGKQPEIVLENISRILQLTEYHCGVSFFFKGLEDIGTYFRQAGYAIQLMPDRGNKIHAFEDCPLEGLAQEFRMFPNWKGWVSPVLLSLIDMDSQQGTELYTTLFYYLANRCHIGNTAMELDVHRNTVINRIEKIERVMDVDLQDERTLVYLRFCYSLMKCVYPAETKQKPMIKEEDSAH